MYLEYQLLNSSNVKIYNDYHEAKEEAKKQNLLFVEYGDVYGTDMAFAYWNKSANLDDDEVIIAYYRFNKQGEPVPLSEEELRYFIQLKTRGKTMRKNIYKIDKRAETNGVDLTIAISFYKSHDDVHMQLCSCTISDGSKSIDYAYVVGTTTLDEVIKDFLDNQD